VPDYLQRKTSTSSAVAEMGDHGHNRHGPKRGGCCAPELDPVQYNVAWAEVYFCTKWCLHPSSRLATTDMNRKLWATTPSNTTSPGTRFTSIPSGILTHPAVWPQQKGPKIGGLCSLCGEELGPHLAQCGLDQGPPPYQVPS